MKVVVLGAGVIGVSSAWYLSRAGHEVVVLERNAGAACETSFGNGGQISVSHAEPWANPQAPLQLLRWLGREDAPLLFRLRADPAQWRWGLKFLRECLPRRSRHNLRQLLNLGLYSRSSLQALRAETGIDYQHLVRGILHFYTEERAFAAARRVAAEMSALGCERRVLDRDAVLALEPALAHARAPILGGTYTAADESGDAHLFSTRLAALCAERGVRFRYGVRVTRLLQEGGRMCGIELAGESGAYEVLAGDAYVLALGAFSGPMAMTAGLALDIYPVKGYSATLPLREPARAPTVSLTDESHRIVFSRLGERLRVAGTAELGGWSMALNRVRCEAIVARALQMFPDIADGGQARYWTGLRPGTPGNLPYIGASPVAGLYLNTGHGTLGWTHACGSGRALAELIDGRRPDVAFDFRGLPPR